MIAWGDTTRVPRTIFVQAGKRAAHFGAHVLPCLPSWLRFVLIIGDHDVTTPLMMDARFPGEALPRVTWEDWLQDDRIVHLFVENLDEWPAEGAGRSKVSPMPIGLNPLEFPHHDADWPLTDAATPPAIELRSRPLVALNVGRSYPQMTRGHPGWREQFGERARVSRLCRGSWAPHCVERASIGGRAFFRAIQAYPFLLCVHGGGVDPNPKAFTALLAGVVPIIRSFGGDAIYRSLPVVIVQNWTEDTLTASALERWRDAVAPHFESLSKRSEDLRQLTAHHWWMKVERELDGAVAVGGTGSGAGGGGGGGSSRRGGGIRGGGP